MRNLRMALVLGIVSLVTPAVLAQTLGAVMTGSQEVPANTTPGFGNSTVTFDATRQNLIVTITVSNLGSPINNFHIHEGAAGAAGPVRVSLIALGGTFNNGTMTGTFPVAADVAQRMIENPGNFYVNVQQASIGSYFTGVDLTNAANLTLSFDASAPIFGYAAVTDNVSGSPTFVAAQSDIGVSAN